MRIRAVVSGVLQTVLLGCGGEGAGGLPVEPPEARPGRLVVERIRRGHRRLLDAPARATYCKGDSVLVIVALGSSWSAGLALRTPFPPDSVRTLPVSTAMSDGVSATAAFRAVGDSIRPALEVDGGTVSLSSEASATGSFVITLSPRASGSAAERLAGSFRSLPTADTTASCAANRAGR